MRDLRNLYVRANACVACHQNLAPELLKAGHPDLFFELDGQSVAEPKHWVDEEPWSGLRQWLTGQAVALREMSWALATDPTNDALSVARWDGLAWLCATATSAGSISSPISQPSGNPGLPDFTQMQSEADAFARRAAVSNWSESSARAMLTALAAVDGEFIRRERRTICSPSAPNASSSRSTGWQTRSARIGALPLKIDSELNQLFEDVKTLDSFDAPGFAGHLRAFREALRKKRLGSLLFVIVLVLMLVLDSVSPSISEHEHE